MKMNEYEASRKRDDERIEKILSELDSFETSETIIETLIPKIIRHVGKNWKSVDKVIEFTLDVMTTVLTYDESKPPHLWEDGSISEREMLCLLASAKENFFLKVLRKMTGEGMER